MSIVSSAPDPYAVKDLSSVITGGNGYTQASSTIAAPSTTKTIITAGQSNMASVIGTAYTVTNSSSVHMLNIYDGGFYNTQDPVLGCAFNPASSNISNIVGPLGDNIINRAKATRVITCSVGIGGTTYASWEPGNAADHYTRLKVAILRCRARGLEPDFIIWGMGESDNIAGTSAASIKASIWATVDALRASPVSCNTPVYIGLYSMFGGTISATVRSGVTTSVDAGRIIRLGYDADTNATIAGGFREADGTHFNNTGRNLVGAGWGSLILP